MRMSPEKMNGHANAERRMPQINGKTILVGGLLLVLAFMWIRVFFGGSDVTEEANAEVNVVNTAKPQKKVMQFKRRPLPFEFGRHDRLTIDMFSSREIRNKNAGNGSSGNEESVKEIKSQKDAADRMAKKLKIEAIILGVDKLSHKAFINGKLQVAGDKLEVKLNDNKYELVVADIFHNKVVLKWDQYTISVRMSKLNK